MPDWKKLSFDEAVAYYGETWRKLYDWEKWARSWFLAAMIANLLFTVLFAFSIVPFWNVQFILGLATGLLMLSIILHILHFRIQIKTERMWDATSPGA